MLGAKVGTITDKTLQPKYVTRYRRQQYTGRQKRLEYIATLYPGRIAVLRA